MINRVFRTVLPMILIAVLLISGSGCAEQSGFSDTARWIPISSDSGSTLYLAAEVSLAKPYDADTGDWETSDLRAWLNGEYLNSVLTEEERSALLPVDETGDLVTVCPSDLLPDPEYMAAKGSGDEMLWTDPVLGTCWWWLRDMGGSTSRAAVVNEKGEMNTDGTVVWDGSIGVRPLIRVADGTDAVEAVSEAREVIVVTVDSNIRSGPSGDTDKVGYVYKDTVLTFISSEDDYYLVMLENGVQGYIKTNRGDLVQFTEGPDTVRDEDCIGKLTIRHDTNVRSGNSAYSDKVGYLYSGSACGAYGSENNWYLVKLDNGTVGWVPAGVCELTPSR